MGIINKLSKNVYEKIAAGEVIDRPSSALRELLDNSFDASATKIKATFKEGGLEELFVFDNGEGIYFDDLPASVLKHHTSKIKDFDDIYKIYSMGFRGEALSSIAAVSRLSVTSFNKNDIHGGELYTEANSEPVIKPFVRSVGTTVKIKNLFYNVPARARFVKSVSSEARSLKEVFTKKTLPFYDIAVELYNGDKCIVERPSESLSSRVAEYNKLFLSQSNLLELETPETEYEIKIYGYIASPDISYHNKSSQHFYVNKRPVNIPSLYYAISSSFEGVMAGNRYPVAFIFIDIKPELIDVNIHPAKKEVKVVSEKNLTHLVRKSIENALKKNIYIPSIDLKQNSKEIKGFEGDYGVPKPFFEGGNYNTGKYDFLPMDIRGTSDASIKTSGNEQRLRSGYKVLGNLFDTYILVEKDLDLYMIDYHAAHERMNYESLKSRFSAYSDNMPSQKLLTPLNFDLSPSDADVLSENIDEIKKTGYEIESFGDASFAVYALPGFKTYGDDIDIILSLLDKIKDGRKEGKNDYLLDELLKIESCRSSFKSGDNPDINMLKAVIENVLNEQIPLTCPHGRPIVSKINKKELDKKFKRI